MRTDRSRLPNVRALCRGCGRDLQRESGSALLDVCYWCAQRAVAAERLAFIDRVHRERARRDQVVTRAGIPRVDCA